MRVHPSLLVSILSGHRLSEVKSDMPSDVEIVDMRLDYMTRTPEFVLSSSTFAIVPELATIPQWDPVYTSWSPANTLVKILEDERSR